MNKVQKIAILKSGALGDFLVSLPAIRATHERYPEAEIVLLGAPWQAKFLQPKRSPIDRVIVVPVCKGIREEAGEEESPEEIETFVQKLREEQFDIALHFQGKGIAANKLLSRIDAKMTVGIGSMEAIPLDRTLGYYYYQNEAIRFMEVAGLAGAGPSSLEPSIAILPEDGDEAEALLAGKMAEPYLTFHPCPTDIRRMWPIHKFALLADNFIRKGYHILFTGTEKDKPVIESIIDQMEFDAALNTCGILSLGGLAAIIEGAALAVASDTGPLHLARAVGTPTVGIYWAPNLINWGPLTRGRHRPAISWNLRCPKCGAIPNNPYPFEPASEECNHMVSFVAEVPVDEVMQLASQLLSDAEPATPLSPSMS